MTVRSILGLIIICCLALSAHAQTVSDALVESLNKQGFEIQSVGYTWLRRTVVLATDGMHEREIVIARGSGQILQDSWREVSTPQGESQPPETQGGSSAVAPPNNTVEAVDLDKSRDQVGQSDKGDKTVKNNSKKSGGADDKGGKGSSGGSGGPPK